MRSRGAVAPVLAILAFAPAATAGTGGDARTALAAVERLERLGRISVSEADRHRTTIRRARAVRVLLPGARGDELGAVLAHVGRQASGAGTARLRVLTATLDENAEHLAVEAVPAPRADARDADGIVYRAFPGFGLQFHPLATFARLNALVSRGDRFGAARLASRLLELGARRDGSLLWSYEFAFGGGRPPWTSGMAQAVAAQALARAAAMLGAPALLDPARRAFRALPGLVDQTSAGPWVRLYSFNRLVVLNAQLQSALSLAEYGRLVGNGRASALATGLRRAAAETLPRFDTGYWSRYTLAGEASLGYHTYVVKLLRELAEETGLPFWARAASRFDRYSREPPRMRSRRAVPVLYPTPADGWRDGASIRFWLSKRSVVSVQLGDENTTLTLGQGVHALRWSGVPRRPGDYAARLTAVDLAGNRASLRLPDLRVRVDRAPPRATAELDGRRLEWRVRDRGTPYLRLALVLRRDGEVRVRDLGSREHRGSLRLRLPRRGWHAGLRVVDVSGNGTQVPLGPAGGSAGRSERPPTIA
jgi:hypothetical protein